MVIINLYQQKIDAKKWWLEYVNTKEQIAKIFTKVLSKDAHEYLRDKLGVIPPTKVT